MDTLHQPSQGMPVQSVPGKPPRPHLLVVRPRRVGRGGSVGVAHERTDLLPPVRAVWLGRLHLVSVAGLSAFIVVVLALHGIQANLNPAEHTISEYSLSSYGWLMRGAFVALGVGTLAMAGSLRLIRGPSGAWLRGVGLFMLACVALGAFLDAGFNTDHLRVPETADGTVHGIGTAILVLALPGAALVFGSHFVLTSTSALKASLLLSLGAAQLGAIVLFQMSPVTLRGWAERLVAIFAVATLGLLEAISRSNEQAGQPRPVTQPSTAEDRSSVFRRSQQVTKAPA